MARKPPPKGKQTDAPDAGRRAVPPPAGLPIMPRPFEVDRIPEGGVTVEVEASSDERKALAQAYDLPAVGALAATYRLRKRGKSVMVEGDLSARVTQICVVTLEPFDSDLVEPVEMEFAPESQVAEAWERVAKAEASGSNAPVEDPPDAIVEGRVDLGALTVEALALALDPYPKKPGVAFQDVADPADTPDESPFAALARLKEGEGGGA